MDRRAPPHLTGQREANAVCLGNPSGDGKPQTGSPHPRLSAGRIYSIKPVEHLRLMLRSDANAGIGHDHM